MQDSLTDGHIGIQNASGGEGFWWQKYKKTHHKTDKVALVKKIAHVKPKSDPPGPSSPVRTARISVHNLVHSQVTVLIEHRTLLSDKFTPCLPFLRKRSPDGATPTEVADV